jgi:tellurite methyltransferase
MEKYWNNFYNNINNNIINKESTFAQFIDKFTRINKINYNSFIDLACGNGRDFIYFINKINKCRVYTGIDYSSTACINLLNKLIVHNNIKIQTNNDIKIQTNNDIKIQTNKKMQVYNQSVLDTLPTNKGKSFDVYYCRFLLHSLKIEQLEQFFKNLYNSMHDRSILCIETRSIKGICSDSSNYITYNYDSGIGESHERLLLSLQYLQDIYIKNNFISIYTNENNNLSIYKNDNPYLIRLILKKNNIAFNQLKSIITPEHISNNINYKNVFDELVKIFNDNNIAYVIHYGNLLGLVRHNSLLIPWDDDIDTWMPCESINKLISISDKYNIICNKKGEQLYKLYYKNIIIDIFTHNHFITNYPMLGEQYFYDCFTDCNIINGYKTPKKYKEVFDMFYNFGDYMNMCYIYSHAYNDRWTTKNHKKFKLSLNEVNYMLSIINYNRT